MAHLACNLKNLWYTITTKARSKEKRRENGMDKYIDNKLAEELDLIVLTKNRHREEGLPKGSVGTLTLSYTGMRNPMYAEFIFSDGKRKEIRLKIDDYRVLNPYRDNDVSIIANYLKAGYRNPATQTAVKTA